jgi:hypothetical protein
MAAWTAQLENTICYYELIASESDGSTDIAALLSAASLPWLTINHTFANDTSKCPFDDSGGF